ncbi:hypothetical protein EG868_10895 [Enterococcus faecalis]|uniref:hypothetical protein n=1 Tax=Enterococcus faecalis TaxID=1351 RepID=UPI000FFE3536|nr:hypothetical protein [Enterococcus faecalis]RXF31475.1 hypothetical protein EG868_10895 [Enterococcus faecalis]
MNNYLKKRIQKLSIDKDEFQLKMDLYSTMIPFLLSTEKFKRNAEIRDFTNQLKLKKEMKDYLFASRTQIVARMVREIESFDEIQVKENIQIFKTYNMASEENEPDKSLSQNTLRQNKAEEKILKMMDKYSRNKGAKDE